MGENEIKLLNHLDEPVKLFGIDLQQVSLFGVTFIIGVLNQSILSGFFMGIGLVALLRAFRKRTEGVSITALLYWHLPIWKLMLKLPVPSHIREYVA